MASRFRRHRDGGAGELTVVLARAARVAARQRRLILVLAAVSAAIAGAVWAWAIVKRALVIVLLALFFTYLIAPLVELVRHRVRVGRGRRRRPMPRVRAIAAIYGALVVVAVVLWVAVGPRLEQQMRQLGPHIPDHLRGILKHTQALDRGFRYVGLPPRVRTRVSRATDRVFGFMQGRALRALRGMTVDARAIRWFAVVPVLAFLLIEKAPAFRRSAVRALPRGHLRWRGGEFFREVNGALAAYTRAQLAACGLVGVMAGVGFALLRVPYALLLGVSAGILELVPLIGPVTVAVLAANVSRRPLLVLLWLGAVRVLQDYVIYPRLISRRINLSPLAVIAAIWTGAILAGTLGVLLSVPVVAVLSVARRHWREYRDIEALVSGR